MKYMVGAILILSVICVVFFCSDISFCSVKLINPIFGGWGNTTGAEWDDPLDIGFSFGYHGIYQSFMRINPHEEYFKEKGTYITTGDSVYITINESDASDRIDITIPSHYHLVENTFDVIFTNAENLTCGWTAEETIRLTRIVTSVKQSSTTWGEIKSLFKMGK